jgi:hypothetical protein
MPLPVPGGFAGVKETDFGVLPSATYDAIIEAYQHKDVTGDVALEKWNKKHPDPTETHPGVVNWTFALTTEGYENRKIWHNTTLDPDSRGMLLAVLRAAGYSREELDAPDFVIEDDRIIGQRVRIRVGLRKGDDTQNEVKGVMPADAASEGSLMPA